MGSMDVSEIMNAGVDSSVLLALGAAGGCALCAAISALMPDGKEKAALARRVDRLEMRLASARDLTVVASALSGLTASVPLMMHAGPRLLLADGKSRLFDTVNSSDSDDIARAFGEAMHNNTVAAVEIARAIIDDGVNLNDPKDRKRVGEAARSHSSALSTAFWDQHGELLLSSGLPAVLKDLLKQFFAQVKRLKGAVADLAKEPSFADLDAVLDLAIALIDTARSIIEELERLGAD
jgi:hypothetical protein